MRSPSSLPPLDFNNYSSHILPSHQINSNVPNPLTSHPSIKVITVSPKCWRKKLVNKYNPIIYDDIDDDLYVFKSFGKSMKRSFYYTFRPRSDLILWNKFVDKPEILQDLHIGNNVDTSLHVHT